jgi:hypothetical protein
MIMSVRTDLDFEGDPNDDFFYCEVEIEFDDFFMTVSPSVSRVAGPDKRWIASIDVPDGTGYGLRSLYPPVFVSTVEEGKLFVELALDRMATGMASAR